MYRRAFSLPFGYIIMVNLTAAIAEYLSACQHLSRAARRLRGSGLRRFARFLGNDESITLEEARGRLDDYLISLKGGNLKPLSLRALFFPIFSLYAHFNLPKPLLSIPFPKVGQPARKVLSNAEVARLVRVLERRRKKGDKLAKALFYTFLFGGLRRGEALSLRLDDIDVARGRVHVRKGKGGKERTIYLCDEWKEAMREYLKVRLEGDYLFLYARGVRFGDRSLTSLLKELREQANLPHLMPHTLRHNCATRLLRNGANIKDVQVFLGHADIKTTMIYLSVDEERLREIAPLTSLRGREEEQGHREQGRAKSPALVKWHERARQESRRGR